MTKNSSYIVMDVGGTFIKSGLMSADGTLLDGSQQTVPIDSNGTKEEICNSLTAAVAQGIALSREKILNSVWNYDYFGDARTIDTHVKKLRSKLGEKGDMIKTIWGMGYKFEC